LRFRLVLDLRAKPVVAWTVHGTTTERIAHQSR